jgi:redox-sensitive bicupin YhaK (pirin superfamily)
MIIFRPANTRGNPHKGWLTSFRTFNFGEYFDPKYQNFNHLQTINDDRGQSQGFVPDHEHKNMEIFGYVVEGSCRHTDNLGNTFDIPAGAVQRMSAGSGIIHTEGNASDKPNRYLQLWIQPNVLNTEPTYDWYQFTREDKLNKFCDITEKLPIKQDAKLLSGIFIKDYTFELNNSRKYYLYVVSGEVTINDLPLIEGDGLSFIEENKINITNSKESEIILFDLI